MNAARALSLEFLERHPRHAAKRLGDAAPADVARLLETCPTDLVAEALQHVDPVHVGNVLDVLPAERRRAVLIAFSAKRAALVLQDAGTARSDAWLADLPEELARSLRTALSPDPDTVARWMDPAVLAAPVEMTAGDARALVARHAARALYYLYVIDADRRPVGVLNLRELMGAADKAPLASMMHSPVQCLAARTPAGVAAEHSGWSAFHALPVVDEDGQLVGVVRYETGEVLRGRGPEERAGEGGLGAALAEALWAVTAHLVDEAAAAARPGGEPDE